MLTVLDVATAAVTASQDDPEESDLTVPKILGLLDVVGALNMHIANPLNHPLRYYLKPREAALVGNEPVYGAFLALVYCAHDPFVRLHDYESIELLEEFLGSNGGVVNPFITYCVAFVEGRVQSYRIAYLDADGSVGRFDKHFQNTKARHPAECAGKRWIVWEGDAPPRCF